LWICDPTSSNTTSDPVAKEGRDQVIETVITYLRLATGNEKFQCVKTHVKVAKSTLVDSGISTVLNAMSIIYGEGFENDLGEVKCWEVRERFLRGVVRSLRVDAQAEDGNKAASGPGTRNGYKRATNEDDKEEVVVGSSSPRVKTVRVDNGRSQKKIRKRQIQNKEKPNSLARTKLDGTWLDSESQKLARGVKLEEDAAQDSPRRTAKPKPPKGKTSPQNNSSLNRRWLEDEDENEGDEAEDEDEEDEEVEERRTIPTLVPSSSLDCRWLDQEEQRTKAKEKRSKKSRITL